MTQPEELTAEVMDVDPALAERWLKANTFNRRMRPHLIKTLARDMRAGEWALTGQPIIFDRNGRLLDGQHRLHAVVLAGVTIRVLVVRGVAEHSFNRLDQGSRRSKADVLGLRGEQDAPVLGATLAMIFKWLRGDGSGPGASTTPTIVEIENTLTRHPEVRDSVKLTRESVLVRPTVAAFCHWRFAHLSQVEADDFIRKLQTGTNLPDDHPILLLRERLIRGRTGAGGAQIKLSTSETIAYTLVVWNHVHAGNLVLGKLQLPRGGRWPKIGDERTGDPTEAER